MAQQTNYKTAAELDAYRARQKKDTYSTGSGAPISLPPQEGLGSLAKRLQSGGTLTARAHPRGILARAPSLQGLHNAR